MVCRDIVRVYTKELDYLMGIGSRGEGPGQFGTILGVASDKIGNIYVSDNVRESVSTCLVMTANS